MLAIRKAVIFAVAWLLFYLGCAVSKLMVFREGFNPYSVYNRLMVWSFMVQGEGPGPWKIAR